VPAQRRPQPALDEHRRAVPGRRAQQDLLGLRDPRAQPVQPGARHAQVRLLQVDLQQGDAHPQGHQVMLGAVVQVPLQLAPLPIALGERLTAGGPDPLGMISRPGQLGVPRGLQPGQVQHRSEQAHHVRQDS
jgi:hypothetical protein